MKAAVNSGFPKWQLNANFRLQMNNHIHKDGKNKR
jgi:hypothetical protein